VPNSTGIPRANTSANKHKAAMGEIRDK
jgi:hypothetical protein